jgi:hypothetical protein
VTRWTTHRGSDLLLSFGAYSERGRQRGEIRGHCREARVAVLEEAEDRAVLEETVIYFSRRSSKVPE